MRQILAFVIAFIATSAFAAGATTVDLSHQTIDSGFDGIKGTLEITGYTGRAAPYDVATIIELICSEETTKVTVSFWEDGLPVTDNFDRSRGWLTFGDVKLPAVKFSQTYSAAPGRHILPIIKSLFDGMMSGTKVAAYDEEDAFVPDSSDGPIKAFYDAVSLREGVVPRFQLTMRRSYVERPHSQPLDLLDVDKIEQTIGRFRQLCSVWWSH